MLKDNYAIKISFLEKVKEVVLSLPIRTQKLKRLTPPGPPSTTKSSSLISDSSSREVPFLMSGRSASFRSTEITALGTDTPLLTLAPGGAPSLAGARLV